MVHIDTALERRVWQRVYGREPAHRDAEVPLEQLYATARDCAQLCHSMRLESKGPAVRRFVWMEQRMGRAARQLASMVDGHNTLPVPVGCPGCSRRRKLELCLLWMRDWSVRCREFSGDKRFGRTLAELARMGEDHCRILNRLLGR